MTPQQVAALGPAFAAYLRPFEDCFGQDRTREHLHTYCRGLLSDLPERASNPSPWRRERPSAPCRSSSRTTSGINALRDRLHHRVAEDLAAVPADNLGTVGLLDETSVVKKGKKTPGVQRQYCGAVGKQENCTVSVHLGVARRRLQGPARRRPVLAPIVVEGPAALPGGRHPRRRGVPAQVASGPGANLPGDGQRHRPGLADLRQGLRLPAGVPGRAGRAGRAALAGRSPKSFRCLTARPRGKKPRKGWTGKRADRLAPTARPFGIRRGGGVTLKRQTLSEQVWEAKAAQVHLIRNGQATGRTYWLIVARNPGTGEVEVLRLQRAVRHAAGTPASARLHALERGTRLSGLARSRVPGFGHHRGAQLHAG